MAIATQDVLLRDDKFNESLAVLVFFSFLKADFCDLVIEQPMQWPARLNLQTLIQGLGTFDIFPSLECGR